MRACRRIRGPGIAMVFQEPMTSLNPVFTIGEQIMETIRAHERLSQRACMRPRAWRCWTRSASRRRRGAWTDYPHQLVRRPAPARDDRHRAGLPAASLLIADEPTTALDVTIQAQILDLLLDLRDEFGMAIMIITHNMGVIAETADRVLVMYAGRVVEQAPVARHVRHAAASLHAGPAGLRAVAGPGKRAAAGDPRHAARPGAPPARLPLRRRAARMRIAGLPRRRCRRLARYGAGARRRLHPRRGVRRVMTRAGRGGRA